MDATSVGNRCDALCSIIAELIAMLVGPDTTETIV
jgi:hypothetical protein